MADSREQTATRRFAGTGTDSSADYKKWKRWAQAYIIVQRARNTPEDALGPLLYCLLDHDALDALEDFEVDDFAIPGGEQLILQRLDDRYHEQTAPDKVGEAMDDVFNFKHQKGEKSPSLIGRLKTMFSRCRKEGIEFPDVSKGYVLLRALGLTKQHASP